MSLEFIEKSLENLDNDSVLQNLIAQANARYILYNTKESDKNFPQYTIKDDKLNTLAFQYLNIGCELFRNGKPNKSRRVIEKGAAILEYVNGSLEVSKDFKGYYGLISALAYYVCSHYSKSFILIKKIKNGTIIAEAISLFLNRNYSELSKMINEKVTDHDYADESLAEDLDIDDSAQKVYEIVIAKSLNNFVKYLYTGDKELLETARFMLSELQEITIIKSEPDIWWVIRLLLLITDGLNASSLWNVLGKYFETDVGNANTYIRSLVYQQKGVYELFITQRNSLTKVINAENKGCIVSIPTSSGKTRIAEIAILDCITKFPDSKILFIAPFRSLAGEIENSLDEIFNNLDVSISQLYGGSLFSKLDEQLINESTVIISTPEKAKAILRGNEEMLQQIKLVIIDEGHLLGADKRCIMNEIFYEELKFFIKQNDGRFLLLSAVLPNAEDLAQWLTDSTETVFNEKWRPSDERLGILEWTGEAVNLNWKSLDNERDSFNRNFITSKEQFSIESKNKAIVATSFSLSSFGTVLIFVGLKASVFTLAREYKKIIGDKLFHFKNLNNWEAFELACTEIYGKDSEWLTYARVGIFCHHGDLLSDVRLPMEQLMRSEKPWVIIATSTLGQGVNLGVSTVIFSTLYQAGDPITSRDFWNIAGRAGRAFVDHEGKILVALDAKITKNNSNWKVKKNRNQIEGYFDKSKIDKAQSGCLILIRVIKKAALSNGLSFDNLIELIANDNILEIHDRSEDIQNYLDWIDDALLSLQNSNTSEIINFDWIDDCFRNSLAYIQAQHSKDISGDEVIAFIKARTKGIIKKVGNERDKWKSFICSGISISSNIQIEEKLEEIINRVQHYLLNDLTIDNKVDLLKEIEELISDTTVFAEDYLHSRNYEEIRKKWLTAVSMSKITHLVHATDIVTNHFSFNLPWILNGIAKKIKNMGLAKESETIEELSMLVESGLPDIKSIKIYQAGIRSRSSAKEIADWWLGDDSVEKSIKSFKNELIENAETYKILVTETASSWIDLLLKFSKKESVKINPIPNFKIKKIHESVKRLVAKKINGDQYLLSLDFKYCKKIKSTIDFSQANKYEGIFFDYDSDDMKWKMKVENPYVKLID